MFKKGRKFSRERSQRKALLKSLARSLLLKEKIKTTQSKAKETARFTEKIITKSKKGDLNSRRILAGYFDKKTIVKIFNEIGPRYKERKGGYTRIIKLGRRNSDGAKIAIVELIKPN